MSLDPLPTSFGTTRDALHQVAFFALSPARFHEVGRMGLMATPGGFGTPEFNGRVARVEGTLLVHEQGGNTATRRISTIRDAAEFLGQEYEVDWFGEFHDPLKPADPDAYLSVDEGSALALGNWFEFGFGVLGELRGHGSEDDNVTEVQLWPEHFDPATEMGDHDLGRRASYGASPGDHAHPEPYLYVASWSGIDRSNTYWNDDAFNGGSLSFKELLASEDPWARGLEFLLEGYRILHTG